MERVYFIILSIVAFRDKPPRKSYYDRFREEDKESSSDTKTGFPKPPPKEPLFFTEKTPEGRHTGRVRIAKTKQTKKIQNSVKVLFFSSPEP